MLKFIRAKGSQPSAERVKIQKELFQCQQTLQHGFPNKPVALAWDPILRLMAIATKSGVVKIFGKPGVEFYGNHSSSDVTILKLLFLPGQGRLLSVCDDNAIHLWEVNGHNLEQVQTYELEKNVKKISACAINTAGTVLYFGTEAGNVYQLDLHSFKLEDKVIRLDTVLQRIKEIYQKNPGAVECLLMVPDDPAKLIIGYNKGLLVQWNNTRESTERVWSVNQQLESVAWKKPGEELVSAHNDGSYVNWSVKKKEESLESKITTPYGPFPCKGITKIYIAEGEEKEWIVFSGGMPRAEYGDHNTVSVIHGDSTHVCFDLTSKVIDFFTVASENRKDLSALIILAEEELVAIDLSSEGWPVFKVPYLASLHSSAVTDQVVATVSNDLHAKLVEVGDKQLSSSKISSKPWPIDGGETGEVDQLENHLVLVTGHEDGSVQFWDITTTALKHILKYSTSPLFTGDDFEVGGEANDDNEEEWPPFRKVGVFDPYSDDPRLAVKKIVFCQRTGLVAIGGTAGQVVIINLEEEDRNEAVKVMTLDIVSDRDNFVWKGHSKLDTRTEPIKQPFGYKASSVVQLHPPAAITCLALHSSWGLIAVGTAHGLGLVDVVQLKGVVAKCTLTANDIVGGDHPMSRRKSFKKSLRESFRRLRKGRSQMNTERKGIADKGDDGIGSSYESEVSEKEQPHVKKSSGRLDRALPLPFLSGRYILRDENRKASSEVRQFYSKARSREGSIEVASAMLVGPALHEVEDVIERPRDPLATVLYEDGNLRNTIRNSLVENPNKERKSLMLEKLSNWRRHSASLVRRDIKSKNDGNAQEIKVSRFRIRKTQSLDQSSSVDVGEITEQLLAPRSRSPFVSQDAVTELQLPSANQFGPNMFLGSKTLLPTHVESNEESLNEEGKVKTRKSPHFSKLISFLSLYENTLDSKSPDADVKRRSEKLSESGKRQARLKDVKKFLSLELRHNETSQGVNTKKGNHSVTESKKRRLKENVDKLLFKQEETAEKKEKFKEVCNYSNQKEDGKSSSSKIISHLTFSSDDEGSESGNEKNSFSLKKLKLKKYSSHSSGNANPESSGPTGRRPLKFKTLDPRKIKVLPRDTFPSSSDGESHEDDYEHPPGRRFSSHNDDLPQVVKKSRLPDWYWSGVDFRRINKIHKKRNSRREGSLKPSRLFSLETSSKHEHKTKKDHGSLASIGTRTEWFDGENEDGRDGSPYRRRNPLQRSFEYIDASPSLFLSISTTPDANYSSSLDLRNTSLTSSNLCRTGSQTPVTPTPAETRPVERQIEARNNDDSMAGMIRCLHLATTYIVSADNPSPTLWAGTNSGAVYIFTLDIPKEDKRNQSSVVATLAKEIQLRHRAPVISLSVVDGSYGAVREKGDTGASAPTEVSIPHRLVICSEEQIKIFTLPSLRPFGKFKLTATEGARIRRTAILRFTSSDGKHSENCLVCLTNLGEISILSLPDLKRQMNVNCIRREDIYGISSLVFARNGEAFYMHSSSEIQRIAFVAKDYVRLRCRLDLPEGLREIPKTPEKKEVAAAIEEVKVEPSPIKAETPAPESPTERLTNGVLEETKSSIPEGDFSIGDITIDSIRDHLTANLDETKSSLESRLEKMSFNISSTSSQRVVETVQVIKTKTNSTGETVSSEMVTMETNENSGK